MHIYMIDTTKMDIETFDINEFRQTRDANILKHIYSSNADHYYRYELPTIKSDLIKPMQIPFRSKNYKVKRIIEDLRPPKHSCQSFVVMLLEPMRR